VEQVIATGPDYSVYGLVMQADPVVKGVMLLLVIASVACWAIILEKVVRLTGLSRSIRQLEDAEMGHLDQRSTRPLVRAVLRAAQSEIEDGAARGESRSEMRDRIERAMRDALKSELRRLEVGLPFLATIGSAAPFIGLFGTVWGIVHSFTAIAQQKDTSLAVVAPGIAEALVATALGLAAAIPAVMAYNQISVSLGRAYARGNSSIVELAKRFARPQAEAVRSTAEPIRAGTRY
jgi:biopolymer transport protein ExbB/TolQ